MNIFYLSNDVNDCAKQHVDKHVVKMIIEYAQLMSTAHRVLDGDMYMDKTKNNRNIKRWRLSSNLESIVYKASHINHPSAIWVRESKEHYMWLYNLFVALGKEYTYRYGKIHLSNQLLNEVLNESPFNIPDKEWIDPPPAMEKMYPQCIVEGDTIQSYRNYYIEAKAYFAKWSKRTTPEWFNGEMIV